MDFEKQKYERLLRLSNEYGDKAKEAKEAEKAKESDKNQPAKNTDKLAKVAE